MKTPTSLVAVLFVLRWNSLAPSCGSDAGPVQSITPVTAATVPPALTTVLPRERFQVFATSATKLKKLSMRGEDEIAARLGQNELGLLGNIHGVMGSSTDPQWDQCRHAPLVVCGWHALTSSSSSTNCRPH